MSNLMRMLYVAALVLLSTMLSGCTIYYGGPGSSGLEGDTSGYTAPAPPLPKPSVWRVDPPVLNAEQQKRQDEVDQFLAKDYQAQGYQIAETIQTYDDVIVDWMKASSVQGSDAKLPPPRTEATMLPPNTQLQKTTVDDLQGPDGTIPIPRPSYDAYVSGRSGAASLVEYLTNHVVLGWPSSPKHMYAGMRSIADNQ